MHSLLTAADGRKIKLFAWLPEQEVRYVMVLSHGMAEHIQRYEAFALACNTAGIAVYGANHRGHGNDAPVLGHYADEGGWLKVISDLDLIIDDVTQRHTVPLILFGHSMGSFIAQQYAILHGNKLKGLILSGSNYQNPLMYKLVGIAIKIEKMRIGARSPSRFLDFVSFGAFNRKFKPVRTTSDWLSRDQKQVDKYIHDDYCGFSFSPQFWLDFMSGLISISQKSEIAKIPKHLPIYLFSGDKDPVGLQGEGVLALKLHMTNNGCERVRCKLYPDGRHEMLNESNANEVFNDVITWVISKIIV
ncbi:alpha/beta fold hydrolase [Moritella viscosa]|uniref:Hydrolase, alpha/beta fold family n=1 Tax=Moritella viscosa TaxID=80854 RepID=A0ABY1HF33_9GAMM|nr:alpha/beta hydrolase [Moritella viscosa]SGY89655.1 Hydrolase, alpha/beta fold family [Moritella viscosa]SGY97834.1 Hydrolase, alpha/beta fold family [Moritella viscosa]SHO25859.1 Hydrolase, alpha/beta fold family [Moritella viscosa]